MKSKAKISTLARKSHFWKCQQQRANCKTDLKTEQKQKQSVRVIYVITKFFQQNAIYGFFLWYNTLFFFFGIPNKKINYDELDSVILLFLTCQNVFKIKNKVDKIIVYIPLIALNSQDVITVYITLIFLTDGTMMFEYHETYFEVLSAIAIKIHFSSLILFSTALFDYKTYIDKNIIFELRIQ